MIEAISVLALLVLAAGAIGGLADFASLMGRTVKREGWVEVVPFGVIIGLFVVIVLATNTARAASYEFGTVIHGYPEVPRGDRLVIQGVKVQLWGIESLPASYPVGNRSRQALERFVKDKSIKCMCQNTGADLVADGKRVQCIFKRGPSEGWHLARCFAGGLDLSKAMVSNGWAINDDKLTKEYQGEEDWAHMRCVGMFSGEMCGIFEARYD